MTNDAEAWTPGADASRFPFGENWQRFLATVDERRIAEAEASLLHFLDVADLRGRTVLDLGCGSGLFSLAAYRLGAARVLSVDYDPTSLAVTAEIKRRFAPGSENWTVQPGDALDAPGLHLYGQFDLVYSWGVLHHTGRMWDALDNVVDCVSPDGRLFIAIYNDQGLTSRMWRGVKRTYNRIPPRARPAFVALVMAPRELRFAAAETLAGRPLGYVRSWTEYRRNRGMSRWHDLVDWVGGLPFEVAKPDQIFDFYRARGFVLERLTTASGGLGCNQFVFRRTPDPRSATRPQLPPAGS